MCIYVRWDQWQRLLVRQPGPSLPYPIVPFQVCLPEEHEQIRLYRHFLRRRKPLNWLRWVPRADSLTQTPIIPSSFQTHAEAYLCFRGLKMCRTCEI